MQSPSAVRWNGSCVTSISISRCLHRSLRFNHQQWHIAPPSSCPGKSVKENLHPIASRDFVSYAEVENVASRQGLSLTLETAGPFFKVTVSDLHSKEDLGAAQGLVKLWTCGRILHLDSVRLKPASLVAKRPIFGIAFLLGAVAIRHGYDQNCVKAELLAIKDTDTFHLKLVRYYTRMGFKCVHDVTGESLQDIPHMLIWGGVGTRMDASIEELLVKWSPALKKAAKQVAPQ